jgi:DEAD/DEAH box helicase domain-containing protein
VRSVHAFPSLGDMETAPDSLSAPHASLLAALGWDHTASLAFPARAAAFAAPADLPPLPAAATNLVATGGPLYRHQALALGHHRAGRDIVLATGTGSGKTRVFNLATAALLGEHPRALTLALYPGKALAREQAAKWHTALVEAGLATPGDKSVALITGDQPVAARSAALAAATVALLTPDVLHSWLLARLADRAIRTALARTRLIILDEAHTLAGVFGSNTLHLLRRLQHALHVLHAPAPRWIAASGTLAAPANHLEALTGRPFTAITEDDDTSPRHTRHLHFIRPADATPLSAGLQRWLGAAAAGPARFVVFTQSRKHTELLSLLANRAPSPDHSLADPDLADSDEIASAATLLAATPRVAPYRSGLDPSERADLQDRFARGDLRGLVCTSAFELGIDLPGLNLGFLVGLPDSPASFWQRLGRFGRHGESHIFLIDDGTPRSAAAFASPAGLTSWRARDAALYPDNPILLARHTLCLAHEAAALDRAEQPLDHSIPLSAALRALHAALQRGEPTPALRDAQADQGNTQPLHLAFPLRACEETYKFKGVAGGPAPGGFVTYGQLLREAYPGAVYYHAGQAWRIIRLNRRDHTLTVARERAYHTRPRSIPANLVPDLSLPTFTDLSWPATGLRLLEARARATEAVTGFTELQGNRSVDHDYTQGHHGQTGPLYRSYETTAMLLCHSALDLASTGTLRLLSALLREALVLSCPREAAELAATAGTLKAARRDLAAGRRFVALYDTVPGSLRLSAALAEPAVLRATLACAATLARERFAEHPDADARATLALVASLVGAEQDQVPQALPLDWPDAAPSLAYIPGTTALHRKRQLTVTIVRAFTGLDGDLLYDVIRADDPSFHGTVSAEALVEIPDVTQRAPLAQVLAA